MWDVKSPGSTRKVRPKLRDWSPGEGIGMQGVAVKCVDILQNTGGEGGFLEQSLTLRRESRGSKQD